jgi:hypothetical protein
MKYFQCYVVITHVITSSFFNLAFWCTFLYVIRTNKIHTFYTNVLIQLYCLQCVLNIQVFIFRKTCTCSFFFMHSYKQSYTDAWKNVIKLHVQVFLTMNTWMFQTCRRQYNWIKSLTKNLQFQSSIVDNGRDYVLHYVGMSDMHIFYFCCL